MPDTGQSSNHPPNVLAASWDNCIYCYSPQYGKVVQCLQAHDDAVSTIRLSADGGLMWSVSWDASVKVWQCDHAAGRIRDMPMADYCEHESEVKALDIVPSGQLAVSGGADGTNYCWRHILLLTLIVLHVEGDTVLL